MESITTIGKKTGRKYYLPVFNEAYEHECMNDRNMGHCIYCGEDAYGVEPDARKYECEGCGERGVYGLEELLISGMVSTQGASSV